MEERGNILMYQTADGQTAIEVVLSDETVWLTIDKMADLFQRNKSTISRHIKNILECGELSADSVVAFFATTARVLKLECDSVVRSAKVCTSCLSNLMQILAALLNMSALGSLFTEDKFESQRYRSLQDRRHIIANNENY